MEKLIYGLAGVILIVFAGWYTTHVWSDCLEENSFLTCARMLNK